MRNGVALHGAEGGRSLHFSRLNFKVNRSLDTAPSQLHSRPFSPRSSPESRKILTTRKFLPKRRESALGTIERKNALLRCWLRAPHTWMPNIGSSPISRVPGEGPLVSTGPDTTASTSQYTSVIFVTLRLSRTTLRVSKNQVPQL